MTPEGLVVRASRHEPKETMDRLAAAVTGRGATVVARVDHAAAAAAVGLALAPTEVLIFGNPKAGTPLMLAAQTIGIDLPLKALVWRDAAGATHVGYNDPHTGSPAGTASRSATRRSSRRWPTSSPRRSRKRRSRGALAEKSYAWYPLHRAGSSLVLAQKRRTAWRPRSG